MTGHRELGRDIGLLDMPWAQDENRVYPKAQSRPDACQRAAGSECASV